MGWMVEPTTVEMPAARCGTCGWLEVADTPLDARRLADGHRRAHEARWTAYGETLERGEIFDGDPLRLV